jgi:uncharacterized protein
MRAALAASVVLLAALSPAHALEVPPVPDHYLTDLAGVIPASQAAAIEQRLAAIERTTGHQVIAVIFPSLAGEPLEDFTIRCAERWKVGRKKLDDGAIFFAFVRDRRMRLEVGYGLEATMPDALARRILDGVVKPAFAAGDYGGGVLALADTLERVFAGKPMPAPRRRHGEPAPPLLIALLAGVGLLRMFGAGGRRYRSYRGGGFWGGLGGFGGFGSGGGWGGGGFSAGGGSFGGGGASGSW